jgi:hypothetical protein
MEATMAAATNHINHLVLSIGFFMSVFDRTSEPREAG